MILIQAGANYADLAGNIRCPCANLRLTRHIVKVDPGPIPGRKHTLAAKNEAILLLPIQRLQHAFHFFCRVRVRCFHAPTLEHLICIMIMVMMSVVVVFIMPVFIMIVVMAAVVLVLLVLIFLMIVVMAAVMLMLFVLIFLMIVVMAAVVLVLLVLIFLMIVVMAAVMLMLFVLIFLMIVVMAAVVLVLLVLIFLMIVVMAAVMLMLFVLIFLMIVVMAAVVLVLLVLIFLMIVVMAAVMLMLFVLIFLMIVVMAAVVLVLLVLIFLMIVVMAAVMLMLFVLIFLMIVVMAAVVLVLLVLIFLMIVVMAAVMLMLFVLIFLMIVVMAAVMLVLLMLVFIMIMVMSAIYCVTVLIRHFFGMLIVVVMVMMLLGILQYLCQNLALQILLTFNGFQHHFPIQLIQRCCNDRRLLVMLTNQGNRLINFLLRCLVCTCQNDGSRILNLVDKELTEILKINSCLCRIHHRHGASQLHVRNLCRRLFDGTHHIIKLADAGRLDQDALWLIVLHHLLQRGIEIPYQRAANAARIHLTNLNTSFLQKAAVDADFTELIFNQNNLCACQCIRNQLTDECCLAGTKKPGNNIHLRHRLSSLPPLAALKCRTFF